MRGAVFALDARDKTLDHSDIAPIDAGLHGGDGGAADDGLRPADADAGQAGGGVVQGFEREIDAGGDDAAEIGAVVIDDVEGGRGAEIHHDERAAEAFVAGQRVDQAVGTHFLGVVHLDGEAPVEGGAGDQWFQVEPVAAEAAQVVQRGGHDGADDGGEDFVRLQVGVIEQGEEPDSVFIGGAVGFGLDAQVPRQMLWSRTAKTMLVLPASMTSSMGGGALGSFVVTKGGRRMKCRAGVIAGGICIRKHAGLPLRMVVRHGLTVEVKVKVTRGP